MLNGVFLIDKDCQTTSRKLDNQVGRKFSIRKVGHVGTLDPLATGLMLIAVGEGTKAIPYMEDSTKQYVATFKLGLLTSTLDLEGDNIKEEQVEKVEEADLIAALNKFLGPIVQIPPLTSAIKVDGIALYKYAHKNIDFAVPPRNVEIFELELLDYTHPYFTIKTTVSSGTYIRTLGNDIAHTLNTVATTTNLRRTKVGTFSVERAKKLENIEDFDIITLGDFLGHIPSVEVADEQLKKVLVGAKIDLVTKNDRVKIVHETKLLAIYERVENQTFKCLRGFNL